MKTLWISVVVLATAATMSATQFSYENSGGTVTLSSTNVLTITGATLTTPPGTVSISCPLTYTTSQYPYYSEWACTGGNLSMQSSDGTTAISGSFVSGAFTLRKVTGYHGGTTYYYSLFANFSGSQIINRKSTAVLGAVSEALAGLSTYLTSNNTGTIQTGLIDASQQYEPVYIADTGNNRIVQTADAVGSNWKSFGTFGSGVNQFSQPWGIAGDSTGRIYVSDAGNCRIVRMDNMSGLNWTSFGSCGAGSGQFSQPKGLAVDASGRIYVADSGNNRIVRMDDISGTNFTSLGSVGSGQNQFNNPSGVAFDSAGNLYIADTNNYRVVEVADLSGANWTALAYPAPYVAPAGIWLNSSNQIYFTDTAQNQLYRVDDMTGANAVDVYQFVLSQPEGVFVDPDGAFYIADTGNNRVIRDFAVTTTDVYFLGAAGAGLGQLSQPHGVFALSVTTPVAVPAVTPPSLAFPTQVLGTSSPAGATVLSNIGSAPFKVSGVTSSSADFPQTNNCPAKLAGGQNCSASVIFQPTGPGRRKGKLTFALSGRSTKVTLSGAAALVTVSPSLLIMYEGAGGTVTVTNPQASAVTIQRIKSTGVFRQSNNCSTLAPGASCSINISWSALPPVLGTLIVTDSSGIPQYVSLVGE